MIDQRDYDCPRCLWKSANAGGDRCAHFAVGIWIDRDLNIVKMNTDFIRPMAQHDNDLIYPAVSKVVEAVFDDGFLAKGKQRFERSHAA